MTLEKMRKGASFFHSHPTLKISNLLVPKKKKKTVRSSSPALPPLLDPRGHRRDHGQRPLTRTGIGRLFPGRQVGVARLGRGRRRAGTRARGGRRRRVRGEDLRQRRGLGAAAGVGGGPARGGGARGGV